MAVEVRRAVIEDAGPIAAVHVRAWQVAYRGLVGDEVLDGLSVAQREEVWRQALSGDGGLTIYVAVSAGGIVGFCATAAPSRDDDAHDDVAEVGAIYVEPDVWRTGVGRALMDAALAGLRAAGWRSVTLWVLAENQRARDFYARFGFDADGAVTTHELSGQTEVRLRRPITA